MVPGPVKWFKRLTVCVMTLDSLAIVLRFDQPAVNKICSTARGDLTAACPKLSKQSALCPHGCQNDGAAAVKKRLSNRLSKQAIKSNCSL